MAKRKAAKKLPDGIVQRGRMFYANKQVRGNRLRGKLADDLDLAQELLAEMVAREYRRGLLPTKNDYPWSELTKGYLTSIGQHSPKQKKAAERILNRFAELTGVTNAADVTRDVAIEYRRKRLLQVLKTKGRPPTASTINLEVGVVSHMLREAVDDKKIAFNALARLKKLPTGATLKERRSLEPAEVQRLLEVSPDYLRNAWWMFLNTGIRRRELTTLQFSDVNFKEKTIHIRREVNKSKRERTVPISDETVAMLKKLRDEAAARKPRKQRGYSEEKCARLLSRTHVFVNAWHAPWKNSLLEQFKRYARAAEISGTEVGGAVDLHSLRVSHITVAIDSGADVKAVSENVGHKDPAITMRIYKKANANRRREAVNVLPFTMPKE